MPLTVEEKQGAGPLRSFPLISCARCPVSLQATHSLCLTLNSGVNAEAQRTRGKCPVALAAPAGRTSNLLLPCPLSARDSQAFWKPRPGESEPLLLLLLEPDWLQGRVPRAKLPHAVCTDSPSAGTAGASAELCKSFSAWPVSSVATETVFVILSFAIDRRKLDGDSLRC